MNEKSPENSLATFGDLITPEASQQLDHIANQNQPLHLWLSAGKSCAHEAHKFVSDHTWKAAGIALAAGLLTGRFVLRGRF